jgi:hypothetical protein
MGVSVHSRPTASATILVISGALDTASAEVFQESLLREARSQCYLRARRGRGTARASLRASS